MSTEELRVGMLLQTPDGDGILGRVEPNGDATVALDHGGIKTYSPEVCKQISINRYLRKRDPESTVSMFTRVKAYLKHLVRRRRA